MRAELVDLSLDEVWRGNPRSQTARVALPRIRWRDAGRMIQKAGPREAGKYPATNQESLGVVLPDKTAVCCGGILQPKAFSF